VVRRQGGLGVVVVRCLAECFCWEKLVGFRRWVFTRVKESMAGQMVTLPRPQVLSGRLARLQRFLPVEIIGGSNNFAWRCGAEFPRNLDSWAWKESD